MGYLLRRVFRGQRAALDEAIRDLQDKFSNVTGRGHSHDGTVDEGATLSTAHTRAHDVNASADHNASAAGDKGKFVKANTSTGAIEFATIDHGADLVAASLLDDDHTQYVLKSGSLTQITTRSHTALSDIGTATHAQLDNRLSRPNMILDDDCELATPTLDAANSTNFVTAALDTGQYKRGAKSLKITTHATDGSEWFFQLGNTDLNGLLPGNTYQCSVWVYVDAGTTVTNVWLRAYDYVGSYQTYDSNKPLATGAWTRLYVTFTVRASATQAFVRIYVNQVGSKIAYLDDLKLEYLDGSEMRAIARWDGDSATATASFTNLPTAFRHIDISVEGRSTNASNSEDVQLTFNADTAGNYDGEILYNSAATTAVAAESAAAANLVIGQVPGSSATASIPGIIAARCFGYAAAFFKKNVLATNWLGWGTASGSFQTRAGGGLWRSTAAITRVDLKVATGNWATGSVLILYGIP